MVKGEIVSALRDIVAARLGRDAQFFIVLAYVFGALAGVFLAARWWAWVLVTLLGLTILLVAFEVNSSWFNRQLKVL